MQLVGRVTEVKGRGLAHRTGQGEELSRDKGSAEAGPLPARMGAAGCELCRGVCSISWPGGWAFTRPPLVIQSLVMGLGATSQGGAAALFLEEGSWACPAALSYPRRKGLETVCEILAGPLDLSPLFQDSCAQNSARCS